MTLLLGTDGGAVGATALVHKSQDGRPDPHVWHWQDVAGLLAAERGVREVLVGDPRVTWYGEQPFGLAAAPKAGVRQGQAIGWWQHVATTLGVELVLIAPAVWRRAWGVPHGPGSTAAAARHSRALVRLLWPELDDGPADHGCDSLLMAMHADDEVRAWAVDRLRRLACDDGGAVADEARRLLVAFACGGERLRRRGGRGPGGARITTATTGGAAPTADARPGRRGAWTDELVAAHLARLGR